MGLGFLELGHHLCPDSFCAQSANLACARFSTGCHTVAGVVRLTIFVASVVLLPLPPPSLLLPLLRLLPAALL